MLAGLWINEFFAANLPRDDDVGMVSDSFFFSQSVIGFAIATIILSDGYVKKNCVVTFSWIVKLIFFSLSTCREQLTLKILLTTALTVN